jgi:hypothetical protein
MKAIAALIPKGSKQSGQLIDDAEGGRDSRLQFDTYRHDLAKAQSNQDVWQYLVFAAGCLFFADVFVRRVQVNFAWLPAAAWRVRDKILRRQPRPAPEQTIDRLRSRKAAIAQQIDQHRAAARFEPSPDAPAPDVSALEQRPSGEGGQPNQPSTSKPGEGETTEVEKTDDDYTSRLLKAKKKFREQRKDDTSGPNA